MPNFSGTWTARQQMQAKGASTWPTVPGAPTIGTATAGTNKCASVAFTAPACTGLFPSGVTGYKVTSTPGCFTATGSSSPLTVTGLTAGTSYTFKAQATNGIGYGGLSAASNSITAVVKTCATYTTAGTYSWVAPAGVTSVAALAIGGGYRAAGNGKNGGGGGALAYRNAVSVTPGSSYTVVVGSVAADSSVLSMIAGGGIGASGGTRSGTYTGGGCGGNGGLGSGGGGGAGGYAGNGGNGGRSNCSIGARSGAAGSGGGGGGGGGACNYNWGGGGGGGVGIYGQGSNGAGGSINGNNGYGGLGGSSGGNGTDSTIYYCSCYGTTGTPGSGGTYGGGGGSGWNFGMGQASAGAVRIVWCACGARGTPSFPSTNVGA